tara:strand:+ start:982 stop:2007 length:1026 start_codon:yes stop_codon:yes gene_type:complete
MSNNANYIITTVSKSVSEYSYSTQIQEPVDTGIQLPFRAGPFAQNIRKRTIPYIAVDSGIPPAINPVTFLDQTNFDGTIRADGTPNSPAYIITFTQSADVIPGAGKPHDFALKSHGVTQSVDLVPADGRPFNFDTSTTFTQSADVIPGGGRPMELGLIYDQFSDDGTIRADGRPNDVTILTTFTQSVDLVPADGRPYDFSTLATFTQSADLISADGRPYSAGVSVASSNTYTAIVSASNPNNTTPMHVGSLYLDARTYTTMGALITDPNNVGALSPVNMELRRFTDGSRLMVVQNANTAGPTWRFATTSSVVVSTAGWYDIYISSSLGGGQTSIRGIFYEY